MSKSINAVLLGVIAVLLAVQTYFQFTGTGVPSSTAAVAPNTSTSAPAAAATSDPSTTINFDEPAAEEVPAYDGPMTSVAFAEESHDFGEIKEGEVVKHTFRFTNTGDNPLVIQNAKGSCGCTVPSYPKDPIAPGETGEIQVQFDSKNKEGMKNNSVTITANTEPANSYLRISANVKKDDAS